MRSLLHASCAVVLSVLAACGGGHREASAPMALQSAPLPMYSAGDSYSFGDGTVDTVVGAANDAVRWRNATGAHFVTSRDVMLPPLAWADVAEHGQRSYAGPEPLFPLRLGSAASFTAVVTEQAGRGGPDMRRQENWQCQVGAADRLHLAAGSFDTVRVDCSVTEMPSGRNAQRSFFYAPSIGYYVRRIDRVGDAPPRTVELAAYTQGDPPLLDSALRQRVASIQHALESLPTGTTVRWQDAATQTEGTIEPLRTSRGEDGRWCRDFREQIEAYGRSYALTGAACRETAGGWQVINVGPG
jgi:17 kDa outer membrane surface antigen